MLNIWSLINRHRRVYLVRVLRSGIEAKGPETILLRDLKVKGLMLDNEFLKSKSWEFLRGTSRRENTIKSERKPLLRQSKDNQHLEPQENIVCRNKIVTVYKSKSCVVDNSLTVTNIGLHRSCKYLTILWISDWNWYQSLNWSQFLSQLFDSIRTKYQSLVSGGRCTSRPDLVARPASRGLPAAPDTCLYTCRGSQGQRRPWVISRGWPVSLATEAHWRSRFSLELLPHGTRRRDISPTSLPRPGRLVEEPCQFYLKSTEIVYKCGCRWNLEPGSWIDWTTTFYNVSLREHCCGDVHNCPAWMSGRVMVTPQH